MLVGAFERPTHEHITRLSWIDMRALTLDVVPDSTERSVDDGAFNDLGGGGDG